MTEHKFTDEEIIRALEHCGSCYKGDVSERCMGCPLDDADDISCFDTLLHDLALDIIKRQKAEIETLTALINSKNYSLKGAKTKTVKKFVAPDMGVQLTIDDIGE